MSIRILITSTSFALLALTSTCQAQQASALATSALAEMPAKATSTDSSEGKIAYYGRKFNGRKTASGERFNSSALTMAHRTLPFGTLVRVTNLNNNRSVVVRVNDRGPSTADRLGDLSLVAARKLGMLRSGVADVRLEAIGTAMATRAPRRQTSRAR